MIQKLRVIPETMDLINNEMIILKRTMYKNKNQHRRSQYFQYLSHLNRLMDNIPSWTNDDMSDVIERAVLILETFTLKDANHHHVKWGTLDGILKKHIDHVLRILQQQTMHYTQVHDMT